MHNIGDAAFTPVEVGGVSAYPSICPPAHLPSQLPSYPLRYAFPWPSTPPGANAGPPLRATSPDPSPAPQPATNQTNPPHQARHTPVKLHKQLHPPSRSRRRSPSPLHAPHAWHARSAHLKPLLGRHGRGAGRGSAGAWWGGRGCETPGGWFACLLCCCPRSGMLVAGALMD